MPTTFYVKSIRTLSKIDYHSKYSIFFQSWNFTTLVLLSFVTFIPFKCFAGKIVRYALTFKIKKTFLSSDACSTYSIKIINFDGNKDEIQINWTDGIKSNFCFLLLSQIIAKIRKAINENLWSKSIAI